MDISNNKKGWAAGVVAIVIALLLAGAAGVISTPFTDDPPPVLADGPAPGVAGDHPCLNREIQTPESVGAYYAMNGNTLREEGDPNYAEFDATGARAADNRPWLNVQHDHVALATSQTPVTPTEGFLAKAAWCTGGDENADGSVTWRNPEWVNGGKPLQYAAGKQYWVLFEDDNVIVGILVDCHNLIVIEKGTPPVEPPCDCPEETNTTTPETTVPGTPPPSPTTTVPPPTTTTKVKDHTESPVSSNETDPVEAVRPNVTAPAEVIRPVPAAGVTTTTQAVTQSTVAVAAVPTTVAPPVAAVETTVAPPTTRVEF